MEEFKVGDIVQLRRLPDDCKNCDLYNYCRKEVPSKALGTITYEREGSYDVELTQIGIGKSRKHYDEIGCAQYCLSNSIMCNSLEIKKAFIEFPVGTKLKFCGAFASNNNRDYRFEEDAEFKNMVDAFESRMDKKSDEEDIIAEVKGHHIENIDDNHGHLGQVIRMNMLWLSGQDVLKEINEFEKKHRVKIRPVFV